MTTLPPSNNSAPILALAPTPDPTQPPFFAAIDRFISAVPAWIEAMVFALIVTLVTSVVTYLTSGQAFTWGGVAAIIVAGLGDYFTSARRTKIALALIDEAKRLLPSLFNPELIGEIAGELYPKIAITPFQPPSPNNTNNAATVTSTTTSAANATTSTITITPNLIPTVVIVPTENPNPDPNPGNK